MATNVSNVTSHFPSAENGFTTTLASTISSGAATVPLNSLAGYTNGEIAVFVIDPTDPLKKQTFTGIVDTAGVQITSVVWTAGTNQTHTAGATVVDYATATHISMMTKGILVEHNQDGTHDEALITSRTADASPASGDFLLTSDISASNALKKVTVANLFANIPDGSVTPADLQTGTGTSWTWQAWVPSITGLTQGNGVMAARTSQTGKRVRAHLSFTLGTTSAVTGAINITLPVAAAATYGTDARALFGYGVILDAGAAVFPVTIENAATTTIADVRVQNVAATYSALVSLSSTIPMTWTTGDALVLDFDYEAA